MSKDRPKFKFFIFDCPSDREINGSLPTESDVIRAVLANRGSASKLKIIKCSTAESFRSRRKTQYAGVKYVHIGGHGSNKGLGFIGGWLSPSGMDKLRTLVQNERFQTSTNLGSRKAVRSTQNEGGIVWIFSPRSQSCHTSSARRTT